METAPTIEQIFVDYDDRNERSLRVNEIITRRIGWTALGLTTDISSADALVIVGGDGAFLHAMHRHDFPEIPVVGIKSGTLGFYMDTPGSEPDISNLLLNIEAGDFDIQQLPVLQVGTAADPKLGLGINEVVVERAANQAFKAALTIGRGTFENFVGDGFVFSTPKGSTGYGLSAGGPVIQEGLNAYAIVPSNPHRSHHYYSLMSPAVIQADCPSVVRVHDAEKRPFRVSADGFDIDPWPAGEDIVVQLAKDEKVNMLRLKGHDYFEHVSATFRGQRAVD